MSFGLVKLTVQALVFFTPAVIALFSPQSPICCAFRPSQLSHHLHPSMYDEYPAPIDWYWLAKLLESTGHKYFPMGYMPHQDALEAYCSLETQAWHLLLRALGY